MKRKVLNILITLLFGGLYFYITLPAININNVQFWVLIILLIGMYSLLESIGSININRIRIIKPVKKISLIIVIPLMFIIMIVVNFFAGPLFNSGKYASRIKIDESKSFIDDIAQVDFSKLPLLDKASSQKLGDRVMGQMSDMVSQYNVSNLYTQINYNNTIIRVTPLEYASFIKWITNRDSGVKGYITVDSVTGEASLKRLDKGMKYVTSGYFGDNVYRKLRFSYPTLNFGDLSFEIDNEGRPFWIAPIIKYHAIGLRAKVVGVVVLDPINGTSVKYDAGNIPTWIDIAYSANLIIEQVDDWGTYKGGFFNSVFGQKNVVNTTDGYNYLAMNDDIYLYTGLTSIVNDESNLGFILSNMRTGETVFYSAPGAEEYSAMASAEGAVQQMKYTSTFPLLINLNNKPTYLVSLKDAAGLVKMYGFIDVADYQKVVVSDASLGIEAAAQRYLGEETINSDNEKLTTKEITIKNITNAIINGNTYYFITDNNNQKYKVSITLSDELPFYKSGNIIKVGYYNKENIINVKKVN